MERLKRNSSLDIIRIFALFSVISVHFFMHNGFYGHPVAGKRMYLMVLMRTFFMICVPLFMILTGYLMSSKVLSRKYYTGISKTLFVYLFASIFCILYKNTVFPGTYNVRNSILSILNFSAANYSWYIEMYLGLFLMIPFINLIYNGLKTKRQKQLLIFTFLLLTSFPMITNIFHILIMDPVNPEIYQKILPVYWVSVYPLTYYFIGCYLKEYGFSISRGKNIFLILAAVFIFGSYNFIRCKEGPFEWGLWQEYGSLFNVIMAVLVFGLLLNIKIPAILQKPLKLISDLSLGAYLLSYIFDNKFYPIFIEKVPEMQHRLEYYIIMVSAVFVCSLLLSAAINILYFAVHKLRLKFFSIIFRKAKPV